MATSIGLVYVGLFLAGVVYALIAGALGWLGDLGGGDVHTDLSGHLDAGHAHSLSGTVIATFVTGFGGGGILAHYVAHLGFLGGIAVATASGLVLGGGAFGVLELIFSQTEAGSEFSASEAVGVEGEVISAIPAGGAGEVAYLVRQQRETSAARSADGGAVARGSLVVIDKVIGSTVYVRPKP